MAVTQQDIINVDKFPRQNEASTEPKPERPRNVVPLPSRPQLTPTTIGKQGANPQQQAQLAETETAPKRMTYVDMYKVLNPFTPITPEMAEKERRREKRKAVFSAISDGISAMSNLFFTNQYAPNAYNPREGMAAKTRERWDRMKKDYEDRQRDYVNGYMRAMAMDADQERADRSWRNNIQQQITNNNYRMEELKLAKAKEARLNGEAALKNMLTQERINGQQYRNAILEIQAAKEPEKIDAIIRKYNRTGFGNTTSGSGNIKEYPAYNPITGETINIPAKDLGHAWSQCPEGFTIRQAPSNSETTHTTQKGLRTETETITTTKNSNNNLDGPKLGNRKPNKGQGYGTKPKGKGY